MFDRRRARRALRARLHAGEQVQAAARDAISGDLWVLTAERLLVVNGSEVAAERALPGLAGDVREAAAGTEVRLRDGGGAVLIGSFRGRNRLVARLGELLAQPPSA